MSKKIPYVNLLLEIFLKLRVYCTTEIIKKNTENVRSGSEEDEFSDFIVVKLVNPIKRFKLVEIPNTSVDVTFDKFTR